MVDVAVILAGGLGTRISEETESRPKPMVEVGGRPMLWHIMKIYSAYGIKEFIICLGYKGYVIKEYFSNYYLHMTDITVDIGSNSMTMHHSHVEPWKITMIDTGLETMTGGRLARVREYIGDREFCMTYGDGVADIDIGKLIAFHDSHDRLATVTAVVPPGRFGAMDLIDDEVRGFREKPLGDGGLINGGFFVLSPKVLDLVEGDQTVWERSPMETLAERGELAAFRHDGFWQPMDTLRDKRLLEELWSEDEAPWKVW